MPSAIRRYVCLAIAFVLSQCAPVPAFAATRSLTIDLDTGAVAPTTPTPSFGGGFILPNGTTLNVQSGATFTAASASTVTINGGLAGTPTGGTLSLANLTLTLPTDQVINVTVPGGTVRSLSSIALERLRTPQDYGAVGDGTTHPLSGVYSSLAAAQAAFPITVSSCTYSNASTTVTCADATFLEVGYAISGTNIPAGTTVASITDATHFVLSATPTGSGSGVSLTTSFITSLTQERDYAGMQQCIWLNGSMYLPPGQHLTSTTLKVKSPAHPSGTTITGAGQLISEIVVTAQVDGIRLMQGYPLLHNFAVQYVNGNGGKGSGIILDTGYATNEPPNYTYNWHIDRVFIKGFAQGIYNPYKWDEGSVSRCDFYFCGAAYKTVGNIDTTKITASSVTGLGESGTVSLASVTTNGTAVITCTSTTNILPGMVVRGTDLPDNSAVVSVDSSTQLTLNQTATGSHSGLSMKAYTTGLWVDANGRAIWSSGVFGSLGYAVYGSGNGGALLIAEDLHIESNSDIYYNVPTNGTMILNRDVLAIAPNLYDAWVEAGARLTVNSGGATTVFENGRADIRAINCNSPVDVYWNGFYHYAAQVYHTAAYDDVAGSASFWPAAAAGVEGTLVFQSGFQSGTYRTKIWQCVKTGASTWAWQVINGAATSDDIVTVAHGGTGTASPGLVAGTGITVTGTWPNQTIAGGSAVTLGSYDNSSPAFSSTTFADVTGGSVTATQTGVYQVDVIFTVFDIDSGFKWQYSGTGVGEAGHHAIFNWAGDGVGQINDMLAGDDSRTSFGGTKMLRYTGTIKVTTPGTFKLQAAQKVGTANAVQIVEVSQCWTKLP